MVKFMRTPAALVLLLGTVMVAALAVPLLSSRAQVQPPAAPYPGAPYSRPAMPPGPPNPAYPAPVQAPIQAPIQAPVQAPIQAPEVVAPPAAVAPSPAQAPAATPPPANAAPAPARSADGLPSERVEADVSTRSVAVTSSFTGTEIIIFGSVEHSRQSTAEAGLYDIAIVVEGVSAPIVTRLKSNVAGIWLNTKSVQFREVPVYYAITSTRPIEEITDLQTLEANDIGFESIGMPVAPETAQLSPAEKVEFTRAVIRLKQKEKLYQKSDYGVAFIGRSLFRSTISLPANVPVGPLVTRTYLFKDGKLLSKHTSRVALQREGLERLMYDFAFKYPLFYGIFAVLFAVAAGMIASTLFKRGSH